MIITNLIIDAKRTKFDCVQAYFHDQLLFVTEDKNGKLCVKNEAITKELTSQVMSIIEEQNNTRDYMKARSIREPFIADYYNSIGGIIAKYFKIGEGWIPAFLAIEVFRQFTERGYSTFKDVDLMALLSEFERGIEKGANDASKHYRCANEIVDSLTKKKVFKKYKSKTRSKKR